MEDYLKDKTIDQVISRVKHCESLLKVNSVFHVVLGATTSLNSLEQEIFDKLDPNEIDHLRFVEKYLLKGKRNKKEDYLQKMRLHRRQNLFTLSNSLISIS